eukprot:gene1710-2582_t
MGEKVRKLGSVVVIDSIAKHPNADVLGIAAVKGWQVVINLERDGFKAGDLAVYVEIDSVVPPEVLEGRPEYAILEKKKFQIRTAKIRGELSQGILFPLSVLKAKPEDQYKEGDDITEELRLKKRAEPQISAPKGLSGGAVARFPAFVPKTDEERIQNMKPVLPNMYGMTFYITEKVDGSSLTAFIKDNADGEDGQQFNVCSRNLIVESKTLHGKAAADLNIENKMRTAGLRNIALQGELLGPSVQGNHYAFKTLTVRFFSVFDIAAGRYMSLDKARDIVENTLGLEWVPVIDKTFVLKPEHTVAYFVEMADGKSVLNPKTKREGLVFRAVEEAKVNDLGRASFKAISNQWLLKYDS